MEYMAITVQSLPGIEPGARNDNKGVINRKMQMPDLSGNSFKG